MLDEAKSRYAEAISAINRQKEIIAEVKKQIETKNAEINLKNAEGVSILEIQGYKRYIRILENRQKEEEEKLESLERTEKRRRHELIAAKTGSMSIEKIKYRRLAEHMKAEQKKEELAIDEFVSNQISRQRSHL